MSAGIIIVLSDGIYHSFLQLLADWFGTVDNTGNCSDRTPAFFAINLISIFAIFKIPPEEFYGYILQENVYISIVKYLQN